MTCHYELAIFATGPEMIQAYFLVSMFRSCFDCQWVLRLHNYVSVFLDVLGILWSVVIYVYIYILYTFNTHTHIYLYIYSNRIPPGVAHAVLLYSVKAVHQCPCPE